jgi:hypothetical protein
LRTTVCVILILAAVTGVPAGTAAAAGSHPTVGTHHFGSDPNSPAFTFGLSGGFSRGGSFRVTIYTGGSVKLTKQSTTSPIRLADSQVQIRRDALNGLLKLAEAENFFKMPGSTVGPSPPSEAATSFIVITTSEGTKRVTIRAAHVPAFNELYAVLSYATGLVV